MSLSNHPEALRAARVHYHDSSDAGNEENQEEEEHVPHNDEAYAAFSFFASSSRETIAIGVPPRSAPMIVDGALIDTGSSILSSIGEVLTTALRAASNKPAKFESWIKKIRGIGGIELLTLGTIPFSFFFGAETYDVLVHVVKGDSPLIFSHLDIDRWGLN